MHLRIKYSSCCGLWPYAIWLAPASPLLIFWAASTSPAPSPGSILSGPLLDFLLPLPSTSHLAAWFLRLLAKTHTHKTIVNRQLSQSWKARRESIFSTASSQNEPQVTNVVRVLIPPFPTPPPKHLPRNPMLFHFSNSPPLLHCNATFSVFNITIHLSLFLESVFLFFL